MGSGAKLRSSCKHHTDWAISNPHLTQFNRRHRICVVISNSKPIYMYIIYYSCIYIYFIFDMAKTYSFQAFSISYPAASSSWRIPLWSRHGFWAPERAVSGSAWHPWALKCLGEKDRVDAGAENPVPWKCCGRRAGHPCFRDWQSPNGVKGFTLWKLWNKLVASQAAWEVQLFFLQEKACHPGLKVASHFIRLCQIHSLPV